MASVAVTPTMPGTIATPPSYPGGLKRKRVLISNDDDSAIGSSQADIPSSPTKKLKVSFNLANNVTHVMEDWNEKGVQLVREEVRRALRQHRAGDSAEYDQLREHFALKRSAAGSLSSICHVANFSLKDRRPALRVRTCFANISWHYRLMRTFWTKAAMGW